MRDTGRMLADTCTCTLFVIIEHHTPTIKLTASKSTQCQLNKTNVPALGDGDGVDDDDVGTTTTSGVLEKTLSWGAATNVTVLDPNPLFPSSVESKPTNDAPLTTLLICVAIFSTAATLDAREDPAVAVAGSKGIDMAKSTRSDVDDRSSSRRCRRCRCRCWCCGCS